MASPADPNTSGPVATIVVAAGSGVRLGAGPKGAVPLGGRPLVTWSVATALAAGSDVVVVVAPPDRVASFAAFFSDPRVTVVAGGAARQDSVRAGLAAIPASAGVVLVHDAARPLAGVDVFQRVAAAVRAGAAAVVPVLPAVDSIRRVGPAGTAPVDRSDLRRVQTPQGFAAAAFRAAHAAAIGLELTDDATVMERAGQAVAVVDGDPDGFKVTEPNDLV
ncbi:MAG: 2-C-methyl-D-erythritol 4-phosphate cytidylyltransferase, partial [Propionibacteriaceae bacterium]|nr:2-C-methyl-D-erythritol 4-phosphate cytidylyltransferase [Propionibacteriaceae bacterium]